MINKFDDRFDCNLIFEPDYILENTKAKTISKKTKKAEIKPKDINFKSIVTQERDKSQVSLKSKKTIPVKRVKNKQVDEIPKITKKQKIDPKKNDLVNYVVALIHNENAPIISENEVIVPKDDLHKTEEEKITELLKEVKKSNHRIKSYPELSPFILKPFNEWLVKKGGEKIKAYTLNAKLNNNENYKKLVNKIFNKTK